MKNEEQFIKISNRLINLNKVTYIFFDKKENIIRFNFNNDVGFDEENTIAEYFFWTLPGKREFEIESDMLIQTLEKNSFLIPIIVLGRANVININRISYVKYNYNKNKIIFNFDNSRTIKGKKTNDFAFWELNNENELNLMIAWLETKLKIKD